jgi:hypothetical protein
MTICYISMTDSNYCAQRNLNQIFNVPPTRFNMFSVDPYLSGSYTNFDLDMRRKTEILKYSSARMPTQTNNLTKKQTYAGIVKGSITSKKTVCYDATRPTPTSSCGVPGPIMYLYNNPNVPLYNYATGNRSYAFSIPTATDKWRTIPQSDVAFSIDSSGIVFYLQITNLIDQPAYSYATSFPIGISVSSLITKDMSDNRIMTIDVSNIRMLVNYNNQLVAPIHYSINSDVSMNVSITGASGENLSILQYLGTAVFPKMDLYTQSGYVYIAYLQANVTAYFGTTITSSTRDVYFDRTTMIGNMSSTVGNSTNCIVNRVTPIPLGNTGFVFRDVLA